MKEYYARRASEYESIYQLDDPGRQGEQRAIAEELRTLFKGRRVLEVACGTGYWIERIADVADLVVGVDAAPETLNIAAGKALPAGKVSLVVGDAYELEHVAGTFDAGLANFWLSHVPKARLREFLDGFHRRLGPCAVVFMADNVDVPGVGGEFLRKPGVEDTFKLRRLSDGSTHEVLKNYYGADELRAMLTPYSENLRVHIGTCFWWASYRVPDTRGESED